MMNEREFKLETSTHEEFVCDQDRMEINGETWAAQYIVLGPPANPLGKGNINWDHSFISYITISFK